jgi:hypothetical protein
MTEQTTILDSIINRVIELFESFEGRHPDLGDGSIPEITRYVVPRHCQSEFQSHNLLWEVEHRIPEPLRTCTYDTIAEHKTVHALRLNIIARAIADHICTTSTELRLESTRRMLRSGDVADATR